MTTIETNDIIDVRDLIARVEELREQRTDRWVAGYNMPGYMPDSDPAEFETADEAKRYIIGTIKLEEDTACEEKEAEELAAFAEDVNLQSGEFSAQCGNCVYWVTLDGTMGLDEEEQEELQTIEALLESLKGCGGDEQWEGAWYPATLIRDDYFVTYARELVSDIGDIPRDIPSYIEIDWEATAKNIRMDYSSVEIDGVTYWYR
jgi:hypothetical protein